MPGGSPGYDYVFKVLLVGDSMVGKSSLVLRYSKDEFRLDFVTTIGVDFLTKHENFEGTKVVMQIWDTAGQSRFRSITSSYYRGAHGVAVVFDLTCRKSFSNVPYWINDVKGMARRDIPVLLIGNKSDLESMREVTSAEAQQLAEHNGFEYLETSAKMGDNVSDGFSEMGRKILDQQKSRTLANNTNGTPNFDGEKPKTQEHHCCVLM